MKSKLMLQHLLKAGTAVIADVFDTMGQTPPVLDNNLFPIPQTGVCFAGPAYTVTGESRRSANKGDKTKLAAIDNMPAGAVSVWAGNDINGVCCFGDLLATAMKARGCVGIVVDGGVRDVSYLHTLGLPIMARYRTPAQAIGRWQVTAYQVPIKVKGALEEWVTINPNDIIAADADGVIIIPANLVSNAVTQVTKWASSESKARADISNGLYLLDALKKYGHL